MTKYRPKPASVFLSNNEAKPFDQAEMLLKDAMELKKEN